MFETLLTIAMIGTGAQADGWPVLWPTVPPVVQQRAPLESTLAADDSAVVLDLLASSGTAVRIVLEPPPEPTKTLERTPGPSHSWPDYPCLMCLANSLVGVGYDANYLRGITHTQWQTLWNNYHNGDPDRMKEKPRGQGYIGYGETGGYSTSGRRGLFGRRR